jgi:glutathione synthase/RimK-type ligase-like ATP-grasp enzyme
MNHPLATYSAESKLLQLQKASALGLVIPRTLVTTDPDEAFRFFDECEGGIVVKALRRGVYERDEDTLGIVRTTRLKASDRPRLSDVKYCPALLQEYVHKKIELRVTIVGTAVFTCEIHSQADERTAVDWRRYDVDIPYRVGTLPKDVQDTLLELMKQLGIVYGACDLILTEDGRYCFLEVNPSGQWLWLERKVGLPISQAVATQLVQMARR